MRSKASTSELQRPFEISNPEVLENFNVWSGPGKTDEPYRLNTKAIYREREGNWFRATAQWQRAFRSVTP